MVKYMCKNCDYRFESIDASNCHFCGIDSIEVEKSAVELLDDVDRLLKG